MSIRADIKQLDTSAKSLRKFGLVVGGVFAALGLLYLLRHKARYPYFLIPGATLIVFGLIAPRVLKYVYIAWMSLAFVLGFIVSNVLLTLFFFVVITPIGLIARGFGSDFLSLKWNRNSSSYWISRERKPRKPTDYERQF
jgi:hypothetical protein